MEFEDVKHLAAKLENAQSILDEIRASSGFDALGESRVGTMDLRETALEAAERAFADRRARAKDFADEELFGEPAWDILLDLFIRQSTQRNATVRTVSVASGVSNATALRWITLLEREGLIFSDAHPKDELRRVIRLTPEGYASMLSYLERIAR